MGGNDVVGTRGLEMCHERERDGQVMGEISDVCGMKKNSGNTRSQEKWRRYPALAAEEMDEDEQG